MKAIEILRNEHVLIRRVLVCLEALVRETVLRGQLDEEAARRTLTFLERFADGRHQDKEEAHLLGVALERAPEEDRRAILRLLRVHNEERELLGDMAHHLELAASGDAWSVDLFAARARQYIAHQREHARAEDEEVFPLVERILGARDDAEIVAGFAATDYHYDLDGDMEPVRFVQQLCKRMGVEVERETESTSA